MSVRSRINHVGQSFTLLKIDQRGTAAIEFAVVAWLLFAMVLGLLDLGRGIWAYNTLAHATREGARYAIVHGSKSDNPATVATIQDIVRKRATLQNINVTTTWDEGNEPGGVVQVVSQYIFEPVVGMIGISPIQLRATSRMVISQ